MRLTRADGAINQHLWESGSLVKDYELGQAIGLNGRWLNLYPQPGWLGQCHVPLRVSDSLQTADDAFRITIAPVQSWVHLPLIFR